MVSNITLGLIFEVQAHCPEPKLDSSFLSAALFFRWFPCHVSNFSKLPEEKGAVLVSNMAAVVKPMGSHFGVGAFTTHFRTYFSGWIESDVHWGLADLGFEKPMATWCRRGFADLRSRQKWMRPPATTRLRCRRPQLQSAHRSADASVSEA